MRSKPNPPAGVLFDKDGTLVDFDLTWGRAGYAVMTKLGRGDAAAIDRLATAMHYDVSTRRFAATSPLIGGASNTYVHLWAQALGRDSDLNMLDEIDSAFSDETLRHLAPIGDPNAVLVTLKAFGLSLGLATNDGQTSAQRQLAALKINAHMDFVAGYDSGHGAKPDPGMVLAFAQSLGVTSDRIVMVGDSTHDLQAARASGAVGVAVLSGLSSRDELEPIADYVIKDIRELPALIDLLCTAP